MAHTFGRVTVTEDGRTSVYVWDYVAGAAVPEAEMPMGSDRWRASERTKWAGVTAALRGEEIG